MSFQFDRVPSPIGEILVVCTADGLCALDYAGYEERMHRLLRARFGAADLREAANPQGLADRVRAYFDGSMDAFDDVPLDMGGSPFQRIVWEGLRAIPAGETVTYGMLAARLGRPSASRAVGLANSLNPVAIVVPCHRVVGSKGALTGYAGGLERKRWLLDHEGRTVPPGPIFARA